MTQFRLSSSTRPRWSCRWTTRLKIRMQATKAEKMKNAAVRQLEALAGTLTVISEKADGESLKTLSGVNSAIGTATLNLVRQRVDVSVEVWMQDANAIQRSIVQATDAVQRAEESVEDESGKRERKRKVREKIKFELDDHRPARGGAGTDSK